MQLSQSFIKEFNHYRLSCAYPEMENKTCGVQVKAKYVEGIRGESTDAQRLGLFFEQQILGSSAHNHEQLEPETTAKGKPTADYERAIKQALVFKANIEHHGFIIDQTQVVLEDNTSGCPSIGTLDCVGVYQGKPFIGDPKYTGNFDDKWSDYGWKTSFISEKEKLIIQPIHYTYLFQKKFGIKPRFFFFIHNSKNETESKIIEIVIDDERLAKHESFLKEVHAASEMEIALDEWEAFPTVQGCAKCPIFERCPHKITIPKVETVYIS